LRAWRLGVRMETGVSEIRSFFYRSSQSEQSSFSFQFFSFVSAFICGICGQIGNAETGQQTGDEASGIGERIPCDHSAVILAGVEIFRVKRFAAQFKRRRNDNCIPIGDLVALPEIERLQHEFPGHR